MEIIKAEEAHIGIHAAELADLAYSTGPVSYDYHFSTRRLFDKAVLASMRRAETLFGWDAMHLAMDGKELLGFLVSYHAPEFRERIDALAPAWLEMLEAGEITEEEVAGVLERSEHARWLNPETRPGVYFVHALAVKPEHRGKRIGHALLKHAMELGRGHEHGALELDVLSDNPAVAFYRSMGLELLAETRAPKPMEFGVPPEYRMGVKLA